MYLLWLNMFASLFAASIWGVWMYKWWSRKAWLLAIVLGVDSLVALLIGITFWARLVEFPPARFPHQESLLYLLPLVLTLTAVARYLELRRDEYRAAFSREVTAILKDNGPFAKGNGISTRDEGPSSGEE